MAVKYTNSSLVNYTRISPNKNTTRVHSIYNPTGKITKITIHHMAGNLSIESCGNGFASPSRKGSSNYGIGSDGRVGLYVDEKHRAWTSSSPDNDYKAVTIEVANDGGEDTDWHVSDKAYAKLIDLCVDICKRNGISKLNYTGDTTGNLTRHNMFVATSCPGKYLQSKFDDIAKQVNKRLGSSSVAVGNKNNTTTTSTTNNTNIYRVQVGAFSNKAKAEAQLAKLKKAGFNGFIVTEKKNQTVSTAIKVGDKVKIQSDAYMYGTKTKFASFVYNSVLYVRQISGDRVVVSTQKTGSVTGAVSKNDVIKI